MTGKIGWLCMVLGVLGACGAGEVTFSGNGNYLNPAAWPGGALPTAADAVTVAPGAKLTYAGTGGAEAVKSLTLGSAESALTPATFALSGGTLDVAEEVVLAGAGLLQLGADGRLNARRVTRLGSGEVHCNGGTFGVSGAGQTLAAYFDSVGLIELGARGLTFDTGDNTVWAGDIPLIGETATATVAKTGAGTLGLARLPSVGTFDVAAGQVLVGGARPNAKTNLKHRWTFNDTLEDSIAGCDALLYKAQGPMPEPEGPLPVKSTADVTWAADSRGIVLKGGSHADMIGLGDNILPRSGPVTIELWATLAKRTAKARAFAFGSCQSDGLVFTFAEDETEDGESALSLLGTPLVDQKGTGVLAEGVDYYIVCVIVPANDGGSVVSVYTRRARTGARVGSFSVKTNWTVAELGRSGAWLGWAWDDSDVAAATFEELRVWNAALTESDVDRHALLGADLLPGETTTVDDNVFPENPTFDLRMQNFLAHRWSFNGSWADSIAGQTATPVGEAQLGSEGRQAYVSGASGEHQNYINLGTDVLPKTGPVTLELWSTLYERQRWEKAFAIGSGEADCVLFTYTSQNDAGASSIYVRGNGAACQNQEGTGQYDLGVEYYLCMTFNPRNGGGTDVTARLWDTTTQTLVGTVRYSSMWTPGKLVQTTCRLNDSGFWNDPNPNASYNEFRIWNAGLSEAQQRIDLQLGPDSLPALIERQAVELTPRVQLAEGTTLDLLGDTVATAGLAGSGTVKNGTLEVDGTLAPGGDGTVGTLTLDADVKVVGTIRLDMGDMIVCAGAVDLTEATIEVADKSQLKGSYVFLTSATGGIKGPVKGDNLTGSGKALSVKPECAYIQSAPLAVFLR